jgi:hypothetical protein
MLFLIDVLSDIKLERDPLTGHIHTTRVCTRLLKDDVFQTSVAVFIFYFTLHTLLFNLGSEATLCITLHFTLSTFYFGSEATTDWQEPWKSVILWGISPWKNVKKRGETPWKSVIFYPFMLVFQGNTITLCHKTSLI